MKATVLTKRGFEIREVDKPTIGYDEILIKTIGCGVCTVVTFIYIGTEPN
jgi:D-arabinose 1-dehydrogenase-like Zn-dependent alcohol dehydrogenase